MSSYVVSYSEQAIPAASTISQSHFGVNTLLSYGDLSNPNDQLSLSLAEMTPGRLRYPGGAITETYFDALMDHILLGQADPSLWNGLEQGLLLLDDVLQRAKEMGASLSVVIPTVNAFQISAEQALSDGTYGQRALMRQESPTQDTYLGQLAMFSDHVERAAQQGQSDVMAPWDGDYLAMARQYVANVMKAADEAGVTIAAFEIGNEFWGSGAMTAGEYANLAGQLANALAADFESGVYSGYASQQAAPELLVQSLVAAGEYSPNGPREVVINGQVFEVPDQKGASLQNLEIIEILNAHGAGDHIDGVVNHYYDNKGLDGVDTTSFPFKQLDRWAKDLARSSNLPELTYHITEWDVGTSDPDNGGLQQAQMLIEQFYNMAEHGVDGADIWPLHFYKVQGTSLTDDRTQELAVGGEAFAMMSQSLGGLKPVLDWEVAGEIDLHGYADQSRMVLFVSERTGSDRSDLNLDLSALSLGEFTISAARLLSNDLPDDVAPESGRFANGLPVVTELEPDEMLSSEEPDLLEFDLEDWSILQIELDLASNATSQELRAYTDQTDTLGTSDLSVLLDALTDSFLF